MTELDAALGAASDELDPVDTHRDDMAFWLYSSGSTGKPKGVVHLHHDIAVTCENYAGQVLGLRPDDICFSTTKLFHAYGLGNGLTFPLSFGATAVLMTGRPKPEAILATLRAHRPTVFFSVPGLFALLVRDPGADGAVDSVRFCVSAAEPLPATTIERWRERFGLEIVDGIGSTEMLHIYCSNRPGRVQPGTTGWPVPGYELRLVDEGGATIEGEGTGALLVRGDSCAAFYWHQHEKTTVSMLGDWFATGDRYARGADGSYTYVGRVDDMLKVGGLWVSPVDMEHTLMEHPRVGGVGVVGIRLDETSRIAAYVECDGAPGDDELADELRTWCKQRMRRYEYPHVVVFVDDLPRTLTGKVQRFRLREWASPTPGRRRRSHSLPGDITGPGETMTDRILTTHVGSLPRPQDVVDVVFAQDRGETSIDAEFERVIAARGGRPRRPQAQAGDRRRQRRRDEQDQLRHLYPPPAVRVSSGDVPARDPRRPRRVPRFRDRLVRSRRGAKYLRPICRGPISYEHREPLRARPRRAARGASTAARVAEALHERAVARRHRPVPAQRALSVHRGLPGGARRAPCASEYEAIVDGRLLLQIDAPDLAMGRHIMYRDQPDDEFVRARRPAHRGDQRRAARRPGRPRAPARLLGQLRGAAPSRHRDWRRFRRMLRASRRRSCSRPPTRGTSMSGRVWRDARCPTIRSWCRA